MKDLLTSKKETSIYVQNHNDRVGAKFVTSVTEYTQQYNQGVIHHEEYIKQVKKCCEQGESLLINIYNGNN